MYSLLLLALLGELCYALDIVPHVANLETSAIIEALDEFGMNLARLELAGMDGGEAWRYIHSLKPETKALDQ